MRILAWNINHRTRRKPISSAMLAGIISLQPDVVVLTEYVEGPGHTALIDAFQRAGMNTEFHTPVKTGYNQVLVASRTVGTIGTLFAPPASLGHAASNSIHVRLCDGSFDLIGLRVPSYESVAEKRLYWDWFGTALEPLLAGDTVVIGDMNADPCRSGSGSERLRQLTRNGWRIPVPFGLASYFSPRGSRSRLDHAIVSPTITVIRAEYIKSANGFDFAGPTSSCLSDHTPLILDIAIPQER